MRSKASSICKPSRRARDLASRLLLVDTHIDLPYRLYRAPADVGKRTQSGDFDHVRAREGGLDVAFMAIYVPAEHQTGGGAKDFADRMIDEVEAMIRANPEKFEKVASAADACEVRDDDVIRLALGMENGASLEGDLKNLEHFANLGIRYITLVHSKSNEIGDSSYDQTREWKGLSGFGRELIREMNRTGLMVDVSHLTDDTFHAVLELSSAPVLASHSSCRHFTPDWERNMSDEMICELAGIGGTIQINFGSSFISDRYRRADDSRRSTPELRASVRDVADHIDHVVKLVGVDHVGFGSDFDGVGDSLPIGLKDVSEYPNLVDELLNRGFTEKELRNICAGNALRVWSEVERQAGDGHGR